MIEEVVSNEFGYKTKRIHIFYLFVWEEGENFFEFRILSRLDLSNWISLTKEIKKFKLALISKDYNSLYIIGTLDVDTGKYERM